MGAAIGTGNEPQSRTSGGRLVGGGGKLEGKRMLRVGKTSLSGGGESGFAEKPCHERQQDAKEKKGRKKKEE